MLTTRILLVEQCVIGRLIGSAYCVVQKILLRVAIRQGSVHLYVQNLISNSSVQHELVMAAVAYRVCVCTLAGSLWL